jgi:protein transport protein SEC61 subunit alpha
MLCMLMCWLGSIIYSYFEIAAKEGDMAGLKGMVMG